MAVTIEQQDFRIYRPRIHCELTVPTIGTTSNKVSLEDSSETVTFPIRVRKLHLTRNDHNLADECRIEAEYMDTGLDPRILKNATVSVYIAEEDPNQSSTFASGFFSNPDNLRFVGILTKCTRAGSEEEGFTLSMEFQDYTSMFLQYKHFPADKAIPYSATLEEAWAIICDNTGPFVESVGGIKSVVTALRNRVRFLARPGREIEAEALKNVRVGDAVAERFRKLGKVQLMHPDMDCWAYWQQCIQMQGLISYIYLDECIITTATNLFTSDDPPVLVWGENILSIKEERSGLFADKGIVVRSFDPLTNRQLESFYPPVGDKRVQHKTVQAKAKNGAIAPRQPTALTKGEDRNVFHYPGISDQKRLDDIAKRIWLERSKQELEGTLVTKEMRVSRVSDSLQLNNTKHDFDLLNMGNGDTILVGFDPENKLILNSLGSQSEQIAYLLDRGYSRDVAKYMVENLATIQQWFPNFYVKRVEVSIDADETDCDFTVEIGYVNHINIDGSSLENDK